VICPDCGAEYVRGIEPCADCHVALIHMGESAAQHGDEATWTQILVVTDETEAELIRGYLESEGIPCNLESLVFHAEPFTFGPLSKVRLHVPTSDVERARKLLETQTSSSTVTAVP
jgi:hypothetical protein